MSQKTVDVLEKTIKHVALQIRKSEKPKSEDINALAKLSNALSAQEGKVRDPLEDGDPGYHARLYQLGKIPKRKKPKDEEKPFTKSEQKAHLKNL